MKSKDPSLPGAPTDLGFASSTIEPDVPRIMEPTHLVKLVLVTESQQRLWLALLADPLHSEDAIVCRNAARMSYRQIKESKPFGAQGLG